MSGILLTPPPSPGDDRPKVLTVDGGHIVEYQPQWAAWIRQLVAILLVIGCIVGIILLGPIAQILIASFLIALVMYFPARFLSQRLHAPYKLAVALLYLLVIVLLIIGVVSVIPLITRAVNDLNRSTIQTLDRVVNFLSGYTADGKIDYLSDSGIIIRTPENKGLVTARGITIDLNAILRPISDILSPSTRTTNTPATQSSNILASVDIQAILGVLTGILGGIVSSITGIASTGLLALFISFLILIELPTYERGLLKMIPAVYHRELGLLTAKVMNVWAGFFRGQLIVGLIIGVLTWAQLAVMGIPGALPLAIGVAIISLIPNIGGIIALLPLAIVPLLQGSTTIQGSNVTVALLVVVINLAISQVIWNVVAPSIIGDALNLPLPVIIVGVFFGAAIGGIVGAFLIAPILGMLRVIVTYLLMKIAQQDPFPGERWERVTPTKN